MSTELKKPSLEAIAALDMLNPESGRKPHLWTAMVVNALKGHDKLPIVGQMSYEERLKTGQMSANELLTIMRDALPYLFTHSKFVYELLRAVIDALITTVRETPETGLVLDVIFVVRDLFDLCADTRPAVALAVLTAVVRAEKARVLEIRDATDSQPVKDMCAVVERMLHVNLGRVAKTLPAPIVYTERVRILLFNIDRDVTQLLGDAMAGRAWKGNHIIVEYYRCQVAMIAAELSEGVVIDNLRTFLSEFRIMREAYERASAQ